VLGIVPAAGAASRLQPLAFSKEMLPVGSTFDEQGVERPKAVSEFLVERMIHAGADRICFVLSPDKTDIIPYYARHRAARRFCYVVQERPSGLCDALFRAIQVMRDEEEVLIGLPRSGSRSRASVYCLGASCRFCCSRWRSRNGLTRC